MPQCVVCEEPYTELHPLRHLKCNDHQYCEDCFCLAVERAIDVESNHPVPCGKRECPRLEFEDVRATFARFTTLSTPRRNELLQQYAHQLVEYNAKNRTYCCKPNCRTANSNRRLLDPTTCGTGNDQRLQCPDCSTITCIECQESVSPSADTEHVCNSNPTGLAAHVAGLSDSERWRWRLCGRCVLWGEKTDIQSCNHITCEGCNYQFCFICDREWEEGLVLCTHGCPKNKPVIYDADGYNQYGYHRESGLSREGIPRPRDALAYEENAGSVEPRDENGHLIISVIDGPTESEPEPEPKIIQGWDYEAFEDADLANTGWGNGIWGGDARFKFFEVSDISSNGSDDADSEESDADDDVYSEDYDADDEAEDEESDAGDDKSMPGSVEDDVLPWPGQIIQTWGFDNLAIFPWPSQTVQQDDTGDDPLVEDDGPQPGSRIWGMDADGFDMDGFDMYGLDHLGRDQNGVDPAEALGKEVHW